jgi:S1-C subfamily serine protease
MITRACAPGSPKVTVAGKGVCMPQLFGVPLSQVKKFLKSAPPDPHPFTAVLGINGTTDPMGVRVTEVKPGSAAFAAGIKPNDDIVVSVDAQVVKSMDDLRDKIDKHSPGDVITLLVARAGAIREVKCTLKDDSTVAAPSLPPTAYTPLPPLPPIPSVVIKPVPMKK